MRGEKEGFRSTVFVLSMSDTPGLKTLRSDTRLGRICVATGGGLGNTSVERTDAKDIFDPSVELDRSRRSFDELISGMSFPA